MAILKNERNAQGTGLVEFSFKSHTFGLEVERDGWRLTDYTTGQVQGTGPVCGEALVGVLRPVKSASLRLSGAGLGNAMRAAWIQAKGRQPWRALPA